jgi:hypothetical protein
LERHDDEFRCSEHPEHQSVAAAAVENSRKEIMALYDSGVAAAEQRGDPKTALDKFQQARARSVELMFHRARLVQDVRVKLVSLLAALGRTTEALPLLRECSEFLEWAVGTRYHRTVLYTHWLALESCLQSLVEPGQKPAVAKLLRRHLVELVPPAVANFRVGFGEAHLVTRLTERLAVYFGVSQEK